MMNPMHPHIFGIGLPRCGGQTLQRALAILFPERSNVHSPGSNWDKFWKRSDWLGCVEVFAPMDWLERQFPRSLYILNQREFGWLESCRAVHGRSATWNHPLWKYPLNQFESYRLEYEYSRIESQADEEGRLLVVDLIRYPRWDDLCRFLRVPAPDVPFPNIDRVRRPEPPHLVYQSMVSIFDEGFGEGLLPC